MKSIFFVVLYLSIISIVISCDYLLDSSKTSNFSPNYINDYVNTEVAKRAFNEVEVPDVKNFLERKTAARWAKTWDQPQQISYVYIFIYENCVGYYVCDGKPISSRSYLTREYEYSSIKGSLQAPSLDGTYGEDNVGWHFFDAGGVAVAVEGMGASIIYTNEPLPLKVPDLTNKNP